MTLIELHYLHALAEEQHFGRAAKRCNVSQPTLSMAVRKLEKDLGVLLFERNKSGIHTTTIGTQIIAQAARVIAQTETLKSIADAGKDQLSGTLAMGTIATLAPYLLPALIPQLKLMASTLVLNVVENNAAELRYKLRTGVLDVILVAQPFCDVEFVSQDLFTEPLVVLMNSRHSLAALQFIEPHDLREHIIFLLDESHCIHHQTLAIFTQLNKNNQPHFTHSSSVETIRHMVAANLGMAILPLSATRTTLYTSNLLITRAFAAPAPTRTLSLVWRTSFPRHKTIDLLRQALQICSWKFTTEPNHSSQGLLVENDSW